MMTRDNTPKLGRLPLPTLTCLLTILIALLLPISLQAQSQELSPKTDYSPQDVVKIVVDALQTNDELNEDEGIATVFRFASPGNRAFTGPLDRFKNMIKRGFPDMLNHSGARYDPMEIKGDTAVQKVWLYTKSGDVVGYAFQLGLQSGGQFEGVWMTEAVTPLGKDSTGGTSI